jgi:hypothetical protein
MTPRGVPWATLRPRIVQEEVGMSGYSRGDTRSDWQAEAGIHPPRPGERATGWAGFLAFAGVMLAILGLFQLMSGLTALFREDFYAVGPSGLVVQVSYDAWGWGLLALGAVSIFAAALLLRGNMFGRVLAGIIAVVSSLFHLAFLNAHPWWSVLAIAFNVVVLYAIAMHGSELKAR